MAYAIQEKDGRYQVLDGDLLYDTVDTKGEAEALRDRLKREYEITDWIEAELDDLVDDIKAQFKLDTPAARDFLKRAVEGL